jgi:hypothetical protein
MGTLMGPTGQLGPSGAISEPTGLRPYRMACLARLHPEGVSIHGIAA